MQLHERLRAANGEVMAAQHDPFAELKNRIHVGLIEDLGKQIQERKQELMTQASRGDLRAPMRALELPQQHQKESKMSSRYNEPERDERGRFMSEDERGGYRGGGSGRGRPVVSGRVGPAGRVVGSCCQNGSGA